MRAVGTSRICACVARDSMSDTIPGARSVARASSKRRWMFSLKAGRLLAKFDHLSGKVAERAGRRGIGRVFGHRLAGEGSLTELHRVLDHGREDPMVTELSQVLKHLSREHRASVVEGSQQPQDLEVMVQLQ